jgi:hypothetical protein
MIVPLAFMYFAPYDVQVRQPTDLRSHRHIVS